LFGPIRTAPTRALRCWLDRASLRRETVIAADFPSRWPRESHLSHHRGADCPTARPNRSMACLLKLLGRPGGHPCHSGRASAPSGQIVVPSGVVDHQEPNQWVWVWSRPVLEAHDAIAVLVGLFEEVRVVRVRHERGRLEVPQTGTRRRRICCRRRHTNRGPRHCCQSRESAEAKN